MPTEPPRVYLDACVLLSFVNETADRMPAIEQVLAESRQQKIELITSTMSVVEVACAAEELAQKAIDEETERKIDSLWTPGSVVKLVELHLAIGKLARSLMRAAIPFGLSLKPADAIHLATAKYMGASRFHTYDGKLSRYAEATGLIIAEPAPLQPQLPGT